MRLSRHGRTCAKALRRRHDAIGRIRLVIEAGWSRWAGQEIRVQEEPHPSASARRQPGTGDRGPLGGARP